MVCVKVVSIAQALILAAQALILAAQVLIFAAQVLIFAAERLARKQGQAIVIGHPHPETIAGLAAWLRGRDTTIRLVPLRAQRPLF